MIESDRNALGSTVDVVEAALAAALDRTSDPNAIKALVDELKARREARAKVVSLEAERVRRSGKR